MSSTPGDPPRTLPPGSSGPADAGSVNPTATRRRRVTTHALFDGAQELTIEHGGEEYLLRITRQNKLILTK